MLSWRRIGINLYMFKSSLTYRFDFLLRPPRTAVLFALLFCYLLFSGLARFYLELLAIANRPTVFAGTDSWPNPARLGAILQGIFSPPVPASCWALPPQR